MVFASLENSTFWNWSYIIWNAPKHSCSWEFLNTFSKVETSTDSPFARIIGNPSDELDCSFLIWLIIPWVTILLSSLSRCRSNEGAIATNQVKDMVWSFFVTFYSKDYINSLHWKWFSVLTSKKFPVNSQDIPCQNGGNWISCLNLWWSARGDKREGENLRSNIGGQSHEEYQGFKRKEYKIYNMMQSSKYTSALLYGTTALGLVIYTLFQLF